MALAAMASAATVPAGFVDEPHSSGYNNPLGIVFDAQGRGFVWEKSGRIYIFENGNRSLILDLSSEVGNWRDHGMLGVALDPNFLSNGHIYLSYAVDHHHVFQHGTPNYSPATDQYYQASIHRVARYTASFGATAVTISPSSRHILLGSTPQSGVPLLHSSHGCGALVFGDDGSLLVATGDNASYSSTDAGSAQESYFPVALTSGIIRPAENVGSWRSQLLNCLCGKILRIDPATGAGYPSNPFYRSNSPNAPQSKVWALGLRNPARISLMRGTGSTNPSAGRPGALIITDVGWKNWEELNLCTDPGQNFGWPAFEGLDPQAGATNRPSYLANPPVNLDAPKAGGGYYRFDELIKQDQQDRHAVVFPGIPAAQPTFVHTRPTLTWTRGAATANARTGTYNALGVASSLRIDQPGSPVSGANFAGNCSIASAMHDGISYPAVYGSSLFFADYGAEWIQRATVDASGYPEQVFPFATQVGSIVWLIQDPNDGSLLYSLIDSNEIRRIRHSGSNNIAPTAAAELSDTFCANNELHVRFDGTLSSDPEGGALTYSWGFGDGSSTNGAQVDHFYSTNSTAPIRFNVVLTVTDPQGASDTTTFAIHLNNVPPCLDFASPLEGSYYASANTQNFTILPLFDDPEYTQAQHGYRWESALYHENHYHPEPTRYGFSHILSTVPTPDDGEFYGYRSTLRAVDPLGLSATRDLWLYPEPVNGLELSLGAPSVGSVYEIGASVPLYAFQPNLAVASYLDHVKFYANGELVGTSYVAPHDLIWQPQEAGIYSVSAMAVQPSGISFSSKGNTIHVVEEEDLMEVRGIAIIQPNRSAWTTVRFDQPFVHPPALIMGPPSFKGHQACAVRVRDLTRYGFSCQITEWSYLDGYHVPEEIAYIAVEKGRHEIAGLRVEAGEVIGNHIPVWKPFEAGLMGSKPIVFAQVTTMNGVAPCTVRINQTNQNGFRFYIDEEEAADRYHLMEQISYLAVDRGTAQAGAFRAGYFNMGSQWTMVTAAAPLPGTQLPLIFAKPQTVNGGDPVTLRYRPTLNTTDPRNFDLILQEETSADSEINHAIEEVGYLVFPTE